jgi:hypothetical protein
MNTVAPGRQEKFQTKNLSTAREKNNQQRTPDLGGNNKTVEGKMKN